MAAFVQLQNAAICRRMSEVHNGCSCFAFCERR